jgi:hypothetical protein
MKSKQWLPVFIVFTLSIALASSGFAIIAKSNRATLRGLSGIGVLVEQLPPEVEKEGLTKNQLQTDAESKLRKAGIKILSREECAKTPGEPYLYINLNVNIAKTESDVYPYTIDVMLLQKVSLQRNPGLISYAVTWSIGGVGSIAKPILSQLREVVEQTLDTFIQAYQAENPK